MAKQLTQKELTAAYNEAAKQLGVKPVKRFKDIETAKTRTAELLRQLKKQQTPAGAGRRSEPIDWPFRGNLHGVREGTLNAQFVERLKHGVSKEELMGIVAASDRAEGRDPTALSDRVRGLLRMLHTYNGFGIKQRGDQYKLVTK